MLVQLAADLSPSVNRASHEYIIRIRVAPDTYANIVFSEIEELIN